MMGTPVEQHIKSVSSAIVAVSAALPQSSFLFLLLLLRSLMLGILVLLSLISQREIKSEVRATTCLYLLFIFTFARNSVLLPMPSLISQDSSKQRPYFHSIRIACHTDGATPLSPIRWAAIAA